MDALYGYRPRRLRQLEYLLHLFCPGSDSYAAAMPQKQNEVSGLMIMGLFGGTIFPLLMGFMSDAMGQAGAVIIMAIGVVYLFTYIKQLKTQN